MILLLAPLIILLPFFSAAFIGLAGFISPNFRQQEKLIGGIATLAVFIPFLLLCAIFAGFEGNKLTFEILSWMKTGNLNLAFSYQLDQLSILMGLIVTGIGALIHFYSIGYMHHDPGYYKFFTYLNLFIFAMLNLVLGDNLVVTFLGWEGVGACSYFLIGYWYQDMEKAMAAQKAFIANRIGDFAFLVATFIVYNQLGTVKYSEITLSGESAFWVGLLIFIAATGKSAQIPLYVWLPDAMAGPTPVSALIHAATMVTSGIYLIARLSPGVYMQPGAESVLVFIAVIGALTALLAALIAIAQNDIKKVLAYSTVSQLGFMFIALGAGAFSTAIFHVMTHAFFKACLFLGSGSVIHAMEHSHSVKDPQDIRTMGGLLKYMPQTGWTFIISTLAIAGFPLTSGFFSKDEILGKTFAAAHYSGWYYFVWVIGVITAFMTAFYMTRLTYLTFGGNKRYPADAHVHESSPIMTVPLLILGFLAAVGGFLGLPEVIAHGHYNWVSHHWLNYAVKNQELHASVTTEWILILLSIIVGLAGMYLAYSIYKKYDLAGDEKIKAFFGKFYKVLENKFYVDEFYEAIIVKPFVLISQFGVMPFDKWVVDGAVNGSGFVTTVLANVLRRLQTGIVQTYAIIMVIGAIITLAYLIL
ncbi:MAG: NADH-quinone oxidoreductase subunit L [Bacteroidia bacterium]|nr:NADH-quinone oxidoreductase subunit L [Bacteroidia bacterium]